VYKYSVYVVEPVSLYMAIAEITIRGEESRQDESHKQERREQTHEDKGEQQRRRATRNEEPTDKTARHDGRREKRRTRHDEKGEAKAEAKTRTENRSNKENRDTRGCEHAPAEKGSTVLHDFMSLFAIFWS